MVNEIVENGVQAAPALDQVDRRLIELIIGDARISNRELARLLNISEVTVRRRRARLEEQGVLRYYALPNAKLFNYMDVLIWVKVEPAKVLQVACALAASPKTRSVDVISGHFDLLVTGYFTSPDDLLDFLTRCVAAQDGVTGTETFQSLRVIKRHFVMTD